MTTDTPAANTTNPTDAALHAGFLALLPTLQAAAHFEFRYRRGADHDEAVADVVALCWSWFSRLVRRGKDPAGFATTMANFACRQVRSGRRVCGASTRDVLEPAAARSRGFAVQRGEGEEWEQALVDNTQTPIPDQAAFRIDFPGWLAELGDRNRRIAEAMLTGERTSTLADKFGLTLGRVSQLRREFHDGWHRYTADTAAPERQPAMA